MWYIFLMRFFSSIFFVFISYNSFSLHITYNGHVITSVQEYSNFFNVINNDSACKDYIAIRDRIGSCITAEGPLISPNRGVRGTNYGEWHYSTWDDDQDDNPVDVLEGGFLYAKNIYTMPKTGLCFPYFFESNGGHPEIFLTFKPITRLPVLERASIEEIRDPRNSFYAYSNAFHGENVVGDVDKRDKFTPCTFDYRNVVKCKPSLQDPLTHFRLRFEIDDAANFPMQFRTSHGDCSQPFFLITPDDKLKIVGVHDPGNDCFLVNSIAFPTVATFIDKLIERDAKLNSLVARGLVDPKRSMRALLKEVDNISISQSSISQSSISQSDDSVEIPVPEPFSIFTMGMGLGNLIRNYRRLIKFHK